MKRFVGVWLLWFGLFSLCCVPCAQAYKDYKAERYSVRLTVHAGGGMTVEERIRFRFMGDPFTVYYRELPLSKTDGITVVRTTIDGIEISKDNPRDGASVSIKTKKGRTRVEWKFQPTSDQVREFSLVYEVAGVVRKDERGDLLLWHAVPRDYEYLIESLDVTLVHPPDAPVRIHPWIEKGLGRVQPNSSGAVITASMLTPNSLFTIGTVFNSGTLLPSPPHWQRIELANTEMLPTVLTAAAGLLVVLLVVFLAIWRRHAREAFAVVQPTEPLFKAPAELPAAVGTFLGWIASGNGSNPSYPHCFAALFELARAGAIAIEELPKRLGRHDFLIVVKSRPRFLEDHQQQLFSLIESSVKEGETGVPFSKFIRTLQWKWSKFSGGLRDDLKRRDYFSAERIHVRRQFVLLGGVLLVLGIIGIILTAVFEESVGIVFLILPGMIALAGIMSFILGFLYSPLTDTAARDALQWKQYGRTMKEMTKGKHPVVWTAEMLEQGLPFAYGFGIAKEWVKMYKSAGITKYPSYFKALAESETDIMAAFAATVVYASHTSHSATGAGGAAGGGASGAH